jgi:DNA-binding LytR/AlgR family response regulator
MGRIPRFEKGSPEAKAFMAEVREKARITREAIARGDLEPIDKPKKEKKAKKVKEEIVFKAKEEEVIVSEPEEEEEVEEEVEELPPPPPLPKKIVKKVKIEPIPEPEPEPIPVKKVVKHYEQKGGTASPTGNDKNLVLINHSKGFTLIDYKDIIWLEASDNYTNIFLNNAKKIVASKTLKEFEKN